MLSTDINKPAAKGTFLVSAECAFHEKESKELKKNGTSIMYLIREAIKNLVYFAAALVLEGMRLLFMSVKEKFVLK